jgi:DNA-directed RNA polymerase sigma subunit (sigma70/sigma32)
MKPAMVLPRISGLLRMLSPRQQKVIRLYFRLGCKRPHSAQEMAPELGVRPQAIAAILEAAQRRLAQANLRPFAPSR